MEPWTRIGLFFATTTTVLAILTGVTNRLYFRPDDMASISWFPAATVGMAMHNPGDVMTDAIYADVVHSGAIIRSY
ncbi:MAG TPA: hypothetical protein VF534_22625 [Paraburkholderia sp.]